MVSTDAISASAVEFHHDGQQGILHGHQEDQGGGAFLPLLLLECERLKCVKPTLYYCYWGQINKNYVIFMFDWQFTVFCCEV